ncbi:MAG: nitroreductase family protein [Promethearchaeota archaeon]
MNSKEMLELIKSRQSTRTNFDQSRPIKKESLNKILEAARWAPTPHNMQNFEIIVIDDKQILEVIANLKYTISDDFIKENYQLASFSKEEYLKKKVGILGTRFPSALRNPDLKLDNSTRTKLASFIGRSIQLTSVLLIILYDPLKRAPASPGDFLGIIGLGCVMENMWLMAHSMGIAFHIISSLNIDDMEKEIKTLLNIPNQMKIAFGVRLYYSQTPPQNYLRVRREIQEFVHYNQFGKKIVD